MATETAHNAWERECVDHKISHCHVVQIEFFHETNLILGIIYTFIKLRGYPKISKFSENTPRCGRRVSAQFLVFPISTRVANKENVKYNFLDAINSLSSRDIRLYLI